MNASYETANNDRRYRPRVLVTGGAGFIGSHTVDVLLRQGYRVRVLDDLSNGNKKNLQLDHPRLEFCTGDICNDGNVQDAMRDIQYCLHLAAQVSAPRSVEEPCESAWRNIIGFINVLEIARRQSVQKLVYASSAAVYGNPSEIPLTEHSRCCPINPYGLEKLVDEYYAELYDRLHDMQSLGLRYFNVYGPRQDPSSPYSGVISKFYECLSTDNSPIIFGDGLQTRDFIHVYDVARINVKAMQSDITGTCNVASGSSIDLLELVEIIKKCAGSLRDPEHQPPREGDIRDSRADISRLRSRLKINPSWDLDSGLNDLFSQNSVSEAIN